MKLVQIEVNVVEEDVSEDRISSSLFDPQQPRQAKSMAQPAAPHFVMGKVTKPPNQAKLPKEDSTEGSNQNGGTMGKLRLPGQHLERT